MAFTLITPFCLTEEIKKSRFIVNAASINTVQEASEFIEKVSDLTATHNCWAWKIGNQYRFNDDGEPTSTAGRPILAAIEGQDCDQTIVVITRFFGGIKLGTGGLIRAYGSTASHCLQQAPLQPIVIRIKCALSCLYAEWPVLENRLKEANAVIESHDFNALGTDIIFAITEEKLANLNQTVTNLTRGREQIIILD